jgi:hypothetical protein
MEKIRLLGQTFDAKDKWSKMVHLHDKIEIRDSDNFFRLKVGDTVRSKTKALNKWSSDIPICFPDSNNIKDFRWDDILTEKVWQNKQNSSTLNSYFNIYQ